MANEISLTTLLTLANGTLSDEFKPGKLQIDQSAKELFKRVVSVGTTEETLTFADISTVGFCYMYNLDATNYVQVGNATGSYIAKLSAAGLPALIPLDASATTLYLKANTASCQVLIGVYGA